MVYIPFFVPLNHHEGTVEEAMKTARREASMSLGTLIAIGDKISPEKVLECLQVVSEAMPSMGYRAHESYATLLALIIH